MWGWSDTQTRVLHVVCVEGGRGWRGGAGRGAQCHRERQHGGVFHVDIVGVGRRCVRLSAVAAQLVTRVWFSFRTYDSVERR
jgi:hypothetical protein